MADAPSALFQRMRRVVNAPLLFFSLIVVLIDDAFRVFVVPAVRALAKLKLIRRIEAAIAGLPPVAILLLFLIPLGIIEPFKIYALYLFSQGRFLAGVLTFVLAKIVGLGLAERLFVIGRGKLLSIRWFAWCHARLIVVRDHVHAWLAARRFWQRAQHIVGLMRSKAAALRHRLARLLHSRFRGRWAAARRRIRAYRAA
jgi:hypothetical protein